MHEELQNHPGVNINMTDLDIASVDSFQSLSSATQSNNFADRCKSLVETQVFVLNLQAKHDSLNMFLVLETDLQLPVLLILQSKMFFFIVY